jgi:hypothetical protein
MNVFQSALSLVIYKNGNVQELDIDDLLTRYRLKKGITIEKEIYCQAVEDATQYYKKSEQCLFVCTATPCLKRSYLHASDETMNRLSQELGCEVNVTGCHYQCENGPALTLKINNNSWSFLDISTEEKWREAGRSIQRLLAVESNTGFEREDR